MSIPDQQSEVVAYLSGLAGQAPIETHISAVFAGADTVWKLKKAVRLGFLDFTDIEARRHFLGRELELNAPYVPGLYREVQPVTRQQHGLTLGGDGPVVDWVLCMAKAPAGDFLDVMAAAGRLERPLLLAMADEVAAMHAAQQPVATPGRDQAGRMRQVATGNAGAARSAGLDLAMVAAWEHEVLAALGRAARCLRDRAVMVRRAHGDLHLGNLLMWQGRPSPFDALEFDEELATIDPGYDLAFLLMDLDQRVGREAANTVLSRYVGRSGDAGLVGALAPFLSLRAMIRAHVEAARGHDGTPLLQAALAYLRPARAVAVAIGGLMGTGKSTLARAIAPRLGPAPGALVLRSDEARKRLFGVMPEAPLPKSAYDAKANRRTSTAMLDGMRLAAAGGHAVVVDATFLAAEVRAGVEDVARSAGLPFFGLWLHAPLDVLERRVAARHGDASDADIDVLRRAAASSAVPHGWALIDATDLQHAERQVQTLLTVL